MSIQEWGAISEMVGAIAIIVSLIYVGVQIRQSTQATRVMTSQAFVESYFGVIQQITRDSPFWDVYWRGLSGLSNLQGGELAAFGAWTGHVIRTWESFYFQWKAGAFEDQIWSDSCVNIVTFVLIPVFRRSGKFAAITLAMNSVSLWSEISSAKSHIRSTPSMKARMYRESGEPRDSPVPFRAVEAAANVSFWRVDNHF